MSIRIRGVDYDSTTNQMSDMAHGTYHLSDNSNIYEVQRTNNFEFIVTGIDGIQQIGTGRTYDSAQEVIRLSVESCPIPHFEQSVLSVRRGNNELKYAGVPTFSSGEITLKDFIGCETADILEAWQNLSYNATTEKVGVAEEYKKECTLIEYSPDYQQVRRWKMKGCWISNLSETEMNNESNEIVKIRATIQFDSAVPDTTDIAE